MGKRELVALFCLPGVSWLLFFLAMLCVCLQFGIMVFPDHTHLLFLKEHFGSYASIGIQTDFV